MEKRLQKITIFIILFGFVIGNFCFAQTPSVVRNIRIPLWAEMDAYPELEEAQNLEAPEYEYPRQRILEISSFLINGMVNGYTFTYTPSDKARGVEEYLDIQEIVSPEVINGGIHFASSWFEENRIHCWCEYKRTEDQIQSYKLWSSINNPKIHGRGHGDLIDGFDGIKNAAHEALKDAIRSYYRNIIKNKPKEITGAVLIRSIPSIGIDNGQYVINLDFFLECGRIVEYSVY